MSFLARWAANAAGFFAAILIVPGIHTSASGLRDNIIIALVAGLINAVLSPLFKFFTFPMIILTLGLWLWIANMIMFWFAGYLGREFGFGFTVSGFWAVFFGAVIVSIVGALFGALFDRDRR